VNRPIPEARTGLFRTTPSATAHTTSRAPGIRWTSAFNRWFRRARKLAAELTDPPGRTTGEAPPAPPQFERIKRVVLTDEVSRTLFEEYVAHRTSERGNEETGWVLLGLRKTDEAVVLATLPAVADRDAGEAHVWITGPAHVLASRIVRQEDRRLAMLGVVHTHPGSLRHPSKGDLRGDREWVPQLRGGEGVFGIGTADAESESGGTPISSHPQPHVQTLGPLRFSWYTLAAGEKRYNNVPIELTIGPDVAKYLRPVWGAIEEHAERLDRLARQQSKVRFDVVEGKQGPALAATVTLAEPDRAVRVTIEGKEVRYFYDAGGETFQVELPDALPDQGVYLLLAELAAKG